MKLEFRGVTKRFGSFTANDKIDLTVEPGEIHSLLGENGAGKSTLMNVLFGLLDPDEGEILLDGEPVAFDGPGDAMAAGIGMVHQHFMLIPVFTVAENVMLGHEPTRGGGLLDLDAARSMVREISARFGFNLDPDAKVEDLPVGAQQRVEIVKALARDVQVLVLDEPTAVLTPQETDELMNIMRQLAQAGTSIIFITHKLREVKAVADKITVMRLGKVVGEGSNQDSTSRLAELMVGRSVELTTAKQQANPGEVKLQVSNLTLVSQQGVALLDNVSFDIRAGEVLAVAGVQGNGQTELTETLIGLRHGAKGSVTLDGTEMLGKTVKELIDMGIGYVPEDRSSDGVIGNFTVAENLMLNRSWGEPFVKAGSLQLGYRERFANEAIAEFDIRTQGPNAKVSSLSGGNQQKVIIARELLSDTQLFIASQPTRGVDVGSIEFIHERIIGLRDAGLPVLIVSTELDEVLNLADRIAVMYQGKIVGIVPADTPRTTLGEMMAGASA
ncbi:ABC transporter ATP-binding protein [Leucobacter chinensis]|uniref:ABC transporter ATP-binding protein n=1 Tax=Leucobacter chinensis TaxID=2851010 RepID=UPI001C24EE2E|nr:ABC transporter ATP-binding protein [Leucobacter chinensis]